MFSLQVLGTVAQLERALIAKRTRAGLRRGNPAAIRTLRASWDVRHLKGVLMQLDARLLTVRRMRPGQPWTTTCGY